MSEKPLQHSVSPVLKSRHLVAPDLSPLADSFPLIEMNADVLKVARQNPIRDTNWLGPLSAAAQAVDCREHRIAGPTGAQSVRILVYSPPRAAVELRPAILHIHGGGFVRGMPEMSDGTNRELAADLACVIVSVDYRLAPETRFPGAVEDCFAALRWLDDHAEELGVDRNRIAIKGESSGGGHAATLAIYRRNRGGPPICLQLLDSPMLDDRTGSSADPHPYCGEFVWGPASNRFAWHALLGVEPGAPEVPAGAVPARAVDLTGLPPAFIIVGALDLFAEESMEYARRLIRAGVPTEFHVIAGAFHGFQAGSRGAPQVQAGLRLTRDALARAFHIA
jgi:acetyl esterase/lipase